MATIEIRNVEKAFGTVQVLYGIELAIPDGEFLVLVGPSGCGKSTLLRIVAGLENVTNGTIAIDGRDVTDLPAKARDIAMVFQSYALYPHMTVAENMAFSLRVRRADKKLIEERVAAAAKVLNLTEFLKRRPAELSGGQRQRVAMGRAIVRDPKVFLFDEPLSNLDAKLRVSMRSEIKSMHQRLKTTTIYVTHDQIEAMTMGDRVAVLRAGELQQVGTPTQVYDGPANLFVAGFIGSPPMNLARGTIESENGAVNLRLGSESIPIDAELTRERGLDSWSGRSVIAGLRPEDLEGPGEDGSVPRGGATITAMIDRVEAVGAHLLGFFTVDALPPTGEAVAEATGGGLDEVALITREGTPFCATFEPRSGIRAGETVEVSVDPERLHFFDAATGATLLRGAVRDAESVPELATR
jgi:multiple sugar transport system ATP-binding protein